MPAYQLAFEDLEVARIKPVGQPSADPVAWFRVIWRPGTNVVATVHIYGHAEMIRDRPWLADAATIADAVAFCDRLEASTGAGEYDWSDGTVETSPDES